MENNLCVGLLGGDLRDCIEADVCISTIHRSKDLRKGLLSSSVLQKGGPNIQKELNNVNQGRELDHGQVVMTLSGNMSNFRRLMFICLRMWQDGNEEILRKSITECLDLANLNGFESVLIPPLGTGKLRYPPDKVAQALMEAIIFFRSNHEDFILKTVYVCINEEDPSTKSIFVKTLEQCLTEEDDHSLDEAFRYNFSPADYQHNTSASAFPPYNSTRAQSHSGGTSAYSSPNNSLTSIQSAGHGMSTGAAAPLPGTGSKTTSKSSSNIGQSVQNLKGNAINLGQLLTFSGQIGIAVYQIQPIIKPGTGEVGINAQFTLQTGKKCSVM